MIANAMSLSLTANEGLGCLLSVVPSVYQFGG